MIAKAIIKNNRNETAAKTIEKLTGDKVDTNNPSTGMASIMKRLPEYRRVYKMDTDDKHLDLDKIYSELKTTDSDNTVYNTHNRNGAPIPVALPAGRNAGKKFLDLSATDLAWL